MEARDRLGLTGACFVAVFVGAAAEALRRRGAFGRKGRKSSGCTEATGSRLLSNGQHKRS